MSKTKDETEKVLSVVQVAEKFSVDRRTILRWVDAGQFPNVRKAGPFPRSPFVIPESDVEALKKKLNLV